ncbi:MAG: phosphatidate cytidylyltransferase [Acidimicrobiales bacterium]
MSDDRPDEGAPSDPRPSGRIRIVGAQPATGEHPTVAAQPPPEDPTAPGASEPPASGEPAAPGASEPPPAEDPNRFGAVPIISDDEPPVDPTPSRPAPVPAAADEPPVRPVPDPEPAGPTPDLDDLDLPDTAAVPVVPPVKEEDLDDIRVWAAPDDEPELEIDAGRSATDGPFADLVDLAGGDQDDDLDDLLGPGPDDDLPHWGDPATSDEDDDVAGVAGGPRWRGQGEESGEPEDFSDLAEETRVEPEGEDEMIFDDLGVAAAAIESPAGPPQRRSPYPEPPEDEFADDGGGGGGGFFGREGGGGGGRDMQQAVIVGVGLVVLLFVCAAIGAKALVALVTVVVVLATAEFFTATRRAGYHPAVPVGLVAAGGFVLAAYWRGEGAIPLMLFLVVVTSLCWWLFDAGPADHAVANVGITVFGVMYIGGFGSFAALLLKFPDGIGMLFGAILVSVAADIGGLFVGQRMGRSPLTAASPNKTIEGFVGGIVVAFVAAVLFLAVVPGVFPWEFKDAAVLGIVGGVLTPLGDLCVSRLKRDLGVKDMGNLLPGHGGLLDRFDGLLFVLPATYYVVRLLEVYLNVP